MGNAGVSRRLCAFFQQRNICKANVVILSGEGVKYFGQGNIAGKNLTSIKAGS